MDNIGIERILKEVIIPRVNKIFNTEAMQFLHEKWNAGERPTFQEFQKYNVTPRDATPFLVINTQFCFVERWGELSPIYFEELWDDLEVKNGS